MLRFQVITDVKSLATYLGKSDGGYFVAQEGLHREIGGKAAGLLGLDAKPDWDKFNLLLQGLNPQSGDQLTSKLLDDRIPGWHVTASVPKGVTIALEMGDARVHDVIWDAGQVGHGRP